MAFDGVEGGRTIASRDDGEPVAFEVRADEPDDLCVVVDDQDRAIGERRR